MPTYKVRMLDGSWYLLGDGAGATAKIRALDGSWYVENFAAPPEAKVRLLSGSMGPGVPFGSTDSLVSLVTVEGNSVYVRGNYFFGYNGQGNNAGTAQQQDWFPNVDGFLYGAFLSNTYYFENGWEPYPDFPATWYPSANSDWNWYMGTTPLGQGGALRGGGGLMQTGKGIVGYLQFPSFTPPPGATSASLHVNAAWCNPSSTGDTGVDQATWATAPASLVYRQVQMRVLDGGVVSGNPTYSYVINSPLFLSSTHRYPGFYTQESSSLTVGVATAALATTHPGMPGMVAQIPQPGSTGSNAGFLWIKDVAIVFNYPSPPTI